MRVWRDNLVRSNLNKRVRKRMENGECWSPSLRGRTRCRMETLLISKISELHFTLCWLTMGFETYFYTLSPPPLSYSIVVNWCCYVATPSPSRYVSLLQVWLNMSNQWCVTSGAGILKVSLCYFCKLIMSAYLTKDFVKMRHSYYQQDYVSNVTHLASNPPRW